MRGREHEGARDRDALALAAGELGGQPLAHLGGEADTLEHDLDAPGDLGARERALGQQRQRHHVAHPLARIERGERILEYRLDEARAGPAIQIGEALALDEGLAGGRRQQPEDQPRQRGLAAAQFADDAEHAARRHAERYVIDRDHVARLREQAAAHAEHAAQAAHLDGRHRAGGSVLSHGAAPAAAADATT